MFSHSEVLKKYVLILNECVKEWVQQGMRIDLVLSQISLDNINFTVDSYIIQKIVL